MKQHTVYLGGNDITLYSTDHSSTSVLGHFSHDSRGLESLKKHLACLEPIPLAILADLIEEDFREETLPHARGRDRRALHERHARKLYRSTPFRQSNVVGRSDEGRRNDQVVFSALTNRDNLEPLLSITSELCIPLSGIYSLPMCTRQLVKPLGARGKNILVVSEQFNGGLRETLIRNGKVHFSRLAPVSEDSPEEYCRVLNAEINKTQRYLHTLKLVPRDEPLEVFSLTDTQRVEAIDSLCTDTETIHYHPANLAHIASLTGYKGYPDTRFSDSLFAHLVYRHDSSNHYAQPSHLKLFRTWQLQRASRVAMWLVMVGGLAVSGTNMVDARLMQERSDQVHLATAVVNDRYQQVTSQLPPAFEDARSMREAIRIADQLEQQQVNIEDILGLLGKGFSLQPNLTMDDFKWFGSPDASDKADPGQVDRNGENRSVANIRYVIGDINGQLRTFDGSYQKAHQQIDELVAWLLEQPDVRDVSIVKKPLNTRTDSELQGALNNEEHRETARFRIRLVMEIAHESV